MSDQKTLEKVASSTSDEQPDNGKSGQGATEAGIANRRGRPGALRSRRSAAGVGNQPKAVGAAAQRRTAAGGATEAGVPRFRRRVAMRLFRMLTRTPDDGSGLVPGTPFRKAGVTELMSALHERAADEGAPGANVAARAIEFLKPSEDGEEVVNGASVDKLKVFARMADRFQGGAPAVER